MPKDINDYPNTLVCRRFGFLPIGFIKTGISRLSLKFFQKNHIANTAQRARINALLSHKLVSQKLVGKAGEVV
ncbi:MAG TPA: hypothetical protein VMW07_05420 [Gallionella sp.]|nr:hypothetical protein [Gallionella sp.]